MCGEQKCTNGGYFCTTSLPLCECTQGGPGAPSTTHLGTTLFSIFVVSYPNSEIGIRCFRVLGWHYELFHSRNVHTSLIDTNWYWISKLVSVRHCFSANLTIPHTWGGVQSILVLRYQVWCSVKSSWQNKRLSKVHGKIKGYIFAKTNMIFWYPDI
jgi:hypothetical protein